MIIKNQIRSSLILTLFLLVVTPSIAQNNVFNTLFVSDEKKADQLFEDLSYRNALKLYQRVLDKNPENRKVQYKAAQCYLKLNKPDSFITYMEPLVRYQSIIKPADKFNLAEAYAIKGNQPKALSYYQAYALDEPGDSRTIMKIEAMEKQQQFFQDTAKFSINPLAVNSENSDFAPTYYQEGIIFVSSRRHDILVKNVITWNNEPLYNLFYFANNSLKKFTDFDATLLKGPLTFFDEDQKVMFTGSSMKTKEKIGRLQLFTASKVKAGWGEITTFPYNDLNYSFAYPTISNSGDTLVFASDMPGGYGGMDLYICYRYNDAWSRPENLGANINTEGNEVFPFLSKNNFLYFSSNGRNAIGGLDIFQTDLANKENTRNMGAPLNSNRDDFGFIIEGNEGFFSSNRAQKNEDNLYSFTYSGDKSDLDQGLIKITNLATKDNVPYKVKDNVVSFWGENKEKYKIEAKLNGYDLELLRTAEKDDTLRFKIPVAPKPPSLELVAIVKDANSGKPVVGAQVNVTSLAFEDQSLTTGDDGKITFKAEKEDVFLLTARKGNLSGIYNDMALLSMVDKPIEILLSPQEIVNNRVTAFVVDAADNQEITNYAAEITELSTGRSVTADLNGSLVAFEVKPRQQYQITINKQGYLQKIHKLYYDPEVKPIKEKIKLALEKEVVDFTVKGHIFDGVTGAPIANASIEITSLFTEDQTVTSDQYGNFFFQSKHGDVVILVGTKGEKLGTYNDEILASDLGKVIQVAAYSSKDKEFVNGVVLDKQTQQPVEGSKIFIVDQQTGQKMPFEQKGAAVNFNANIGTHYKITARKSGYDDETITLSYLPGEESYPTNFKLELREDKPLVAMQGYVFDGKTRKPVANAKVEILSLGFTDQVVSSDVNGFFKFEIKLNDAFLATAIEGDKAGMYSAIADDEQIYKTVRIAINNQSDEFLVAGFVIDEKSGELLDQAEVKITQSSTGTQYRTNSNQGIFSFDAMPGNEYQITAKYAGYEDKTVIVPFDRLMNKELGNVSVALKPVDASSQARGYVYDLKSGEPVANAKVEVISLLLPDQQMKTNTNGHFDFEIKEAQEFIVMVTHEEKAGIFTGLVNKEDIHKLIRIGIAGPDEKQKIAGLILDKETGTPIDAAEVVVLNKATGDSINVTQKGGFIEFEAKPGDTYDIVAKKSGYKQATVNLPYNPAQIKAPEDLKIKLQRHRPEVELQGIAYDGKSGKPLESVDLSITAIALEDQNVISDKAGKFTFKAKVEEPFMVIGSLEKMGGYYSGKITLEQTDQVIKVALFAQEDERMIAGFILDKETQKPIDKVKIRVIENSTGQIVPAEINNGLVSFRGYPGSDYTIKAEKPGYKNGEYTLPARQLEKDNPDDFKILLEPYQPEILVKAHFYDGATGKGIPQALVNITGLTMQDANLVTDENGNFEFKAKVADVVMVMGSTEFKAGYFAGQVEESWAEDVLEIAAHGNDEKHTVKGYITDNKTGKPVADATVKVIDTRTGAEVASDFTNGVLLFDGLEGHEYKIIAERPGYKDAVDYITLPQGKPDREPHLKMERYQPMLVVKAHVYEGISGEPVPESDIVITSLALEDQNLVSDQFGNFTFKVKSEDPFIIAAFYGKNSGMHTSQIMAEDAGKIIRIPLFGPRESKLLSGIVIDEETEEPVEEVSITIVEKSTQQPVAVEQKNGSFNFKALPGNVYQLTFSKPGYKEEKIILPYNPVVDPNPDLKVVFKRHRPVVTVKGRIYAGISGAPIANATVDVTSLTQDDQQVVSDEHGNFTFKAKISDAFVLMSVHEDLAGYVNESVLEDEQFEVVQLPMYKRSDRYDLAGFVVDKNTKQPIKDPVVEIIDQSTGNTIDYDYDDGVLSLSMLPDNTYKISITKSGYKEVKVMLPYYPANSQIPAGFTAYMEPDVQERMIKGIAMNGITREPLPDTKISITSLMSDDQEIVSDANGIFNFKIKTGDAYIIMGTNGDLSGIFTDEVEDNQTVKTVRLMLLGENQAINVAAMLVDKITQKPVHGASVLVKQATREIENNLNGAIAAFKAEKGKTYQISVSKAGYKNKIHDFEYNPAEMPLPVHVKIPLEPYRPLTELVGQVYDGVTGEPVANAKVNITSLSLDDQAIVSGSDGMFKFNTNLEDAFIAMVTSGEKTGIYTGQISNENKDNIVRIPIFDPEEGRTVSGFITDNETGEAIDDVAIEIVEQKTQQSVVAVQKNGTLSFESKPNSEYKIVARKDGFEDAVITLPYKPDPDKFKITLNRLKTAYTVVGHVYDGITNQALPQAEVNISSFVGNDKSVSTDQYGYFEFKMKVGDPFVIMANFNDKAGHFNGQLTSEDINQVIEIPLFGSQDPTNTIQVAGFISNQYTGEVIENPQVVVTEKNSGRNVAFVQQDGLLKFEALAGEVYQVLVSKEGFLDKRKEIAVSLQSPDMIKTSIEMQPVKPEVVIKAHIYDGVTGEPLSHATINVSSMYLPDQAAKADQNGDFSFTTYADDVFMIAGFKGNKVGRITGNIDDLQTYKNNIILIPAYEESGKNVTFTLYVFDRASGERMMDFDASVVNENSQQPIQIIRDNNLDIFEVTLDNNYLLTVDKEGYRKATRSINAMFYRNAKVARIKVEMDKGEDSNPNLHRAIVLEANEEAVPGVDIYFYNETLKQEQYLSSGEDGIFTFSAGEEDMLTIIGNKNNRSTSLLDFQLSKIEKSADGLIKLYMKDGKYMPKLAKNNVDVVMVENLSGNNQFFIEDQSNLYKLKNENNRHVLEKKDDHIFIRSKTDNKIDALNWKEAYKQLMADEGVTIDNQIIINNILYDFDRYTVKDSARIELDKIVETMRKYPEIYLEIKSYADSRGNTNYNDLLAARRSNAVIMYLANKGISKYRIITENYGEREILNDCIDGVNCPDDLHQVNRRSEFLIINYSLGNEPVGKLE